MIFLLKIEQGRLTEIRLFEALEELLAYIMGAPSEEQFNFSTRIPEDLSTYTGYLAIFGNLMVPSITKDPL